MDALRQAREGCHAALTRYRALSTPLLDDLSLLDGLYRVYLGVYARRGDPQAAFKVYNRRKFLLCVLYLYSPRTLVGGKARPGLRQSLARIFGLNSPTPVSDNCMNLLFHYERYLDFRRDVTILFEDFAVWLAAQSSASSSASAM